MICNINELITIINEFSKNTLNFFIVKYIMNIKKYVTGTGDFWRVKLGPGTFFSTMKITNPV